MGGIAEVFDLSSTASTGFVQRVERHGLVARHHRLGRPARRRVCPDRRGPHVPRGVWRAPARCDPDGPRCLSPRRTRRASTASLRPSFAAPGARSMIALLRTYLRPYRGALVLVVGLLVDPGARDALPARAQRRHHQQRRGQGRHRLHPLDRRRDARDLGRRRRRARSSRSTGARRPAWRSGATCAARSSARSRASRSAELDTFGTPSLITRNTNDVQQVQMVVLMGLNMMIIAPILAVGGDHHGPPPGHPAVGDPDRRPADHGAHRRDPDVAARCRCSRRCRSRSTGSTRSPARRSAASASSAPSSGPGTRRSASTSPTGT